MPLPSDLLRRRAGPSRPDPPPHTLQPAPRIPAAFRPAAPPPTAAAAATQLAAAASDLAAVHASAARALTPDSPLIPIADALSAALSTLSPGGAAVFAPVVEDFRAHAVSVAESGATPSVPARPVSPGWFARASSFLTSLEARAVRTALPGAQSALAALSAGHASRQAQDGVVHAGVSAGYASVVSLLARSAEAIARNPPSGWRGLADEFAETSPEMASLLRAGATRAETEYASLLAEALSVHAVLRGDLEMERRYAENLQKAAALVGGLQARQSALSSQTTAQDLAPALHLLAAQALKTEGQRFTRFLSTLHRH